MLLAELNDDVLRHIFEKCSLDDVIRLYYVCRKFQAIITHYTFFKKSHDLLMVGHRNAEAVCSKRFDLHLQLCSVRFSFSHYPSEHCTLCRITNASSCSIIGATAATKNMLCSTRGNLIRVVYFWKRIFFMSRTVAS